MSNNGIPPLNDWQEDNYPVIYDEGESQLKYVKTGNKIDVSGGSSSYLVYTALLTQTGTNAPVPTVLQNTFPINDFTWHFNADGQFYIESLSNQFTVGKTVVFIQSYSTNKDERVVAGGNEGADFVTVYSFDSIGFANEILNGKQAMTIQVYP